MYEKYITEGLESLKSQSNWRNIMFQEYSIDNGKANGYRKNTSRIAERLSQFQISIISDESEFDALSEEWNKLVLESGASICQSFEWQRTWWKYYGEKSDAHRLHIFILRNQELLVGIAPFFIDEFIFMSKTIYRCLRLIGTKVMQDENGRFMGENNFSEFMDMIIRPGLEHIFYRMLINHITKLRDMDAVIMEEVPDYSKMITELVPTIKESQKKWEVRVNDTSVFTYIKLPDSWELFLKGLSQNARYEVRKYLKRVREGSAKKVFEFRELTKEDDIQTAFEWLVKTHQQRWNKRGRPGLFAERRKYDLFKELNQVFTQKGASVIQTIRIPNEKHYVAVDLLFKFRNTMYGIHRGFDAESPYAKFNPGSILFYKAIKNAIDEDYKQLNLLRGKEHYKLRFVNEIVQNKNINIELNTQAHHSLIKIYQVLQWFLLKKIRVRAEWNILTIFCHQYSLLVGLNRYRSDLSDRVKRRLRVSGSSPFH